MQVQFLEEGERLVAQPQGRMEAADGAGFASAVQGRIHAGTKSLTIDLEELDFVNLGGVRAPYGSLGRSRRIKRIWISRAAAIRFAKLCIMPG